jgi:ribonucleoside-diphosphate reductase subunit M1
MGKITSMHFAGWKMGLKTGMYYLRTMAASAPIQFTVDQEQLKVEDTNVARSKKRTAGTATAAYSAVPRSNGTQPATANVSTAPEESPRTLVTDPIAAASREPNLPAAEANSAEAQPEDAAGESEAREGDIFSDAVLQCSIENKEACLMCQG